MAVGAGVQDTRIDSSLWIFSVLITIINSAIIIVVIQEKTLRTYTNGFIVSLAISDALTGAVLFPVYILGPSYMIGHTNAIFLFSGVANVCSLSYDRYVAVFRPFRYRAIISKSFKPMVIACWLIPVLIGLIPLAWKMVEADLAIRLSKGYIILLVILVIFAYVCIFGAYCRIFVRLRKKSKRIYSLKGKMKSQIEISGFKTPQKQDSKPENDGFEIKRRKLKNKYKKYIINAKTSDIKRINYENQTVLEDEYERSSTAHMNEQNYSAHENEKSSIVHDEEKNSTAHDEKKSNTVHDKEKSSFNHDEEKISSNHDEEKTNIAHYKEKSSAVHDKKNSSIPHERKRVPALRTKTPFSERPRQSRAERRVAKILAVVVLIFFLSWSPVIFMSLAYNVFNLGEAPTELVVFSAITVAIGSLVNPALYAFLKPDLRKAIAKLFLQCTYTKRAYNEAMRNIVPN